jgi:hypothetical protein
MTACGGPGPKGVKQPAPLTMGTPQNVYHLRQSNAERAI